MIKFKNVLYEKSTRCSVTLIMVFIFFNDAIRSGYIMSEGTHLIVLSTIIQSTISLMAILFIIAIFRIQILNTSVKSIFKDYCEKNNKIETIKKDVLYSMSVGFLTIAFTLIPMFYTMNSETVSNYLNSITLSSFSIALFVCFVVSFPFHFEKL